MFNLGNIWTVARPLLKVGLILLVGHFITVYAVRMLRKMFVKGKVDVSLSNFLAKAVNITLHVLVVLVALNSIGISTTGILAALSAAAVTNALLML